MKGFKVLFAVTLIVATTICQGQLNRYLIRFKDKAGTPFSISNPSQYLSQRALDRRSRYQIPIDSTDLPVSPAYISGVLQTGNVEILNISRWLNQISVFTTDANAVAAIGSLPFVSSLSPIASRVSVTDINKFSTEEVVDMPAAQTSEKIASDVFSYGRSATQVKIHNGQFLHNHGFRGEGMQVAFLDAGFFRYDVLPTFDSIRTNNQILGTWDFVDRESSVSEDNSHGMNCLSTVAANMPGIFVGTAPHSSFYLFRTEDVSSEYPIEEHNLAVGAERADSLGVDICSMSLGYNQFSDPSFDYTYSDMNGNTTISARAVDMAAKKGMVMVVAAGNEGNNSWHYICTPADADSCLTVGAVDTLGNPAGFSSYGPSADGQTKPDVAAVGRNAVVANSSTGLPGFSNGTSFACPNMAGITTCLWQAFPEADNMRIISTLQASGNSQNNPNERTGYGIPDAKKAFVILQRRFSSVQNVFIQCKAEISINLKTDSTMSIELERKLPADSSYHFLASLSSNEPYGMHDFSYSDDLSNTDYGQVNYRYKVVIDNDTTYYLDSTLLIYLINCKSQPVAADTLLITPNPVSDLLHIKVARLNNTKMDIVIHNAIGQKVFSQQYPSTIGSSEKLIPFSSFSKGIYFVTVYFDDRKAVTKKLIKH